VRHRVHDAIGNRKTTINRDQTDRGDFAAFVV
jgi:hypothetical protein